MIEEFLFSFIGAFIGAFVVSYIRYKNKGLNNAKDIIQVGKIKMSQTKIDKELEELIKKFEEQNKDETIWVNGNIYTLVQKGTDGISYFPLMSWTKTKALKRLRKWVNN